VRDSDGDAASSRECGPQWRGVVESRAGAWGQRRRVASSGRDDESPWSQKRGRKAATVRRCRVASTGHDGEAPWSHECRPQQRGGVESHMQALRGSSLSAKLPRPRSSAATMVVVHGFADPSSSG
jgi:hypothetical protein